MPPRAKARLGFLRKSYSVNQVDIRYVDADESLQKRISRKLGEQVARHMHLEDGFSIVAMHRQGPVGLISVYWQDLPFPLTNTSEGYIDIIEVIGAFRRRSIARMLIDLSFERAKQHGVYQLRAWSSEDKSEAIYFITVTRKARDSNNNNSSEFAS